MTKTKEIKLDKINAINIPGLKFADAACSFEGTLEYCYSTCDNFCDNIAGYNSESAFEQFYNGAWTYWMNHSG